MSVNVRFDAEAISAIDEYATHLRRLRGTGVSRADVIRYALIRLPIPADASPELRSAMTSIGAKEAKP